MSPQEQLLQTFETQLMIALVIVLIVLAVIGYIIHLLLRFLKAKTKEIELKNKLAEQQLRE